MNSKKDTIKKEIINTLDNYFSVKSSDESFLNIDGKLLPTTILLIEPDELEKYAFVDGKKLIFKNEYIEKFSPDNVDSSFFWETVVNRFPLFSIASNGNKTISEVKKTTTNMSINFGAIKPVMDCLTENPKGKILEIGPGYGGFMEYLEEFFDESEYYAIDVNPLFVHPRIFKTDGKSISKNVPNGLHVVYSMNVFQHLSKKQRSEYYKKIYKKLKKDGIFVFGMFVETILNKDWDVWGNKDVNGRNYCRFFNQLTIVDTEKELIDELTEIGYKVEKLNPYEDKIHYLTFKCTK